MTRLYTAQDIAKVVPRNIKHIRRKLKLIQSDFGRLIGVGRSSVGAWEENRASPKIAACLAICKIGGCTIDSFLTEKLK